VWARSRSALSQTACKCFTSWCPPPQKSRFFATRPTPILASSKPENCQLQPAASGSASCFLNASDVHEIETAFANLVAQRADALLVGTDPFFITARDQLVALVNLHAVPAIYPFREDAVAGGLISYGASNRDGYRVVGGYTGRILSGENPADLPVQQATKLEMVLNLKTAKALGITFPLSLLGRADEVVE
jgi:putative ABC transport system substrate-binding protein